MNVMLAFYFHRFKENADIFLDRAKIPLNRPFLLTQTQIELAYKTKVYFLEIVELNLDGS